MDLIHERNLPDACFDLTLCDWATYLLEQEQSALRPPADASWEAVSYKRLWVAGQCQDAVLAQACQAAQSVLEQAVLGIEVSRGLYRVSAQQVAETSSSVALASWCRARAAFAAHLASLFQVRISQYSAGRNSFYLLLSDYSRFPVEELSHLTFLRERLLFWVRSSLHEQARLVGVCSWRLHTLEQSFREHHNMWEEAMF